MSYTFDPTGKNIQNQVIGESKTISLAPGRNYLYIIPINGPYFTDSLVIKYTPVSGVERILSEGVDYRNSFQYVDATRKINTPVYAGISFIDLTLNGSVTYNYQTLGGIYSTDLSTIAAIETNSTVDPMFTTWDSQVTLPAVPTVTYPWTTVNVDDVHRTVDALDKVGLVAHLRPKFLIQPNTTVFIPTPQEIGLGNVPNYSAASEQDALDGTSTSKLMTPAVTAKAVQGELAKQLADMGYSAPLAYAGGLNITLQKTVIKYQDITYVIKNNSVPFVTSGVWANDSIHFELFKYADYEKWTRTYITVTGTEPTLPILGTVFDISVDHDSRIVPQLVLNDVLYLIFTVDFKMGTDKLYVNYPLGTDDKLVLHTKRSLMSTKTDKLINKIITVNDNRAVFDITDVNVDRDNLRVVLNDMITLNPDLGDYYINNGMLTVNYRLAVGDILEVENIESSGIFGKMIMRNLVND